MVVKKIKSGAENKLPKGWTWVKVGDIAARVNPGFPSGKHNKEGRGVPHIRPMNISRKGEIDLSEVKYVEVSDYDHLVEGDILFNNTNSPVLLGKTTYIKKDTDWAYSNHMTRIRLSDNLPIEPAWVAHSLHHLFETGFFSMHCRHHVNQASINTTFLTERVSIPLPPLSQQKRIVEKIEELCSQLDAGTKDLRRVQANLARYKASVLKAACEGQLVTMQADLARAEGRDYESGEGLLQRILVERKKKWEEEQLGKGKDNSKLKYREAEPPDTEGLPELPEGWVWATVGQISNFLQYGTSEKANLDPLGIPVLRMGNLQDGRLDFADLKYLSASTQKLENYLLRPGDVLFNRTNSAELVGKTAVYKETHPKATFASYLIRLRTSDYYVPDLVSFYINSFHGRKYISTVVSQQVGQANVNGTKLSNMPIPIMPLAEQRRIVAEVERRFSVIEELETDIESNLRRADRLRQAFLKRALDGKLVPQDVEAVQQVC